MRLSSPKIAEDRAYAEITGNYGVPDLPGRPELPRSPATAGRGGTRQGQAATALRWPSRQVAQHAFERRLVGGDVALGLAELIEYDETDAVAVFFVPHPRLQHVGQLEPALHGEAEPGYEPAVLVDYGPGNTALAEGEVGGRHHPQRHRFTLIVGGDASHELEGVRERVTVIQVHPVALFPLVPADDVGLDFDAPRGSRLDRPGVAGDERLQAGLQVPEQVRRADQRMLGDLGEAGLEAAPGVVAGHLDVADDDDRLVDGADQVPAPVQVDPVLAADRGVGLRNERGRYQAEFHAAIERRGHEARDVADGLTADGDDEITLVDGVVGQHVGEVLGGPERLRCLRIRHGDTVGGDAGGGEPLGHPGRDARVLARLDDQAALRLGHGGHQRIDVVRQAGPDVSVVGAADGRHEDAGASWRGRRQPGEPGEHVQRDRLRPPAVGVDGEDGKVLVYREPPLVHLVEVGPVQHRPVLVAADPCHGLVVADAQVDDPGIAQHGAGPRILYGAAAQRDHRVGAADEVGDGEVLELAEVVLALGAEDLADVTAETLLDQHVTVHERLAEPFRDDVPHRGLAGAHEADEHRHHWPSPAAVACPGVTR